MKSKSVASLVVAFLFSLALAGLSFATDTGPDTIVLKAGKKGDVTFHHKKHQEKIKCGECHHAKGPDGKQAPYTEGMKIQKCDACHNKSFPNKRLARPMKAFHTNCKGCHKAQKKGPTKCKECHIKK